MAPFFLTTFPALKIFSDYFSRSENSSIVNEAIETNSNILKKRFRWEKTQNNQFLSLLQGFCAQKLLPLLFNIRLFLFC